MKGELFCMWSNAKHRYKWSKIEGSIDGNSKLISKLLKVSKQRNDNELHTRILGCNGNLVAVEARYHRKKGCLASYLSDQHKSAVNTPRKSKFEDAVKLLKSEIKDAIEIDKQIIEFSEIKSRIIELCAENSVDIGNNNLKSKHIKHVLGQVWPELRFIPRDGKSDIVCISDLSIEEALLKSVALELSLKEVKSKPILNPAW